MTFPSAALIKRVVAAEYGMPIAAFEPGGGHGKEGQQTRAVAVHLAAELMPINPSAIGKRMGGFDFTNVHYKHGVVKKRAQKDAVFAQRLAQIRERILTDAVSDTRG